MITPSEETYQRTVRQRAVRHFLPEPVPEATVEAILSAGRWTGSSKNTQPWAFVVVHSREGRERLAAAGNFSDPMRAAPLAIALIRTPGGTDFDIGRLAQNMMLAADALGIATCPITLHDEAAARAALGVPDDHGARYAIACGFADAAGHRSRQGGPMPGRRSLESMVFLERFGAPG